jgi:hypothetical protein
MPINPKKIKKIVTNHFDNLSEAEFLKTLRTSSPHLFDENLRKKYFKYDRSQTNPPNPTKIDRLLTLF